MRLKMFEQTFGSEFFFEEPGFQGIGKEFAAENLFEMFLKAALEDDLRGSQCLEQLVGIFRISFCQEEFAGGDVQEGETDEGFVFVAGLDELRRM